LKLPQYPDQTFHATLATTANAVNPQSRTVLVQLEAENPDGKLWPGTFAEVPFQLPADPNILHIPTSALLCRKEGLEGAVIGKKGKIELKQVELGRDLGTQVEILSGLSPDDKVVDSPFDSIAAGDEVKISEASPEKTGGQK
jgi:multidrug efflux pump subunit AcrA (membrane-fusion protein)